MLRSEVDTLLNKITEAENVAEAVRADLSPDITSVQDGIERWERGGRRKAVEGGGGGRGEGRRVGEEGRGRGEGERAAVGGEVNSSTAVVI